MGLKMEHNLEKILYKFLRKRRKKNLKTEVKYRIPCNFKWKQRHHWKWSLKVKREEKAERRGKYQGLEEIVDGASTGLRMIRKTRQCSRKDGKSPVSFSRILHIRHCKFFALFLATVEGFRGEPVRKEWGSGRSCARCVTWDYFLGKFDCWRFRCWTRVPQTAFFFSYSTTLII